MKRFIIVTILVLSVLYLLALAALYIFQRSVLYIPPKVYLTPAGVALFDGYDGPKSAHIIENGLHNNLWYLGGEDIILKAVAELNTAP